MSDSELLELAAKAVGVKLLYCPGGHPRDCTGSHPASNIFAMPVWNPLEDDGDALRLAVKLTVELDICHRGIAVRTPNGIKVLVDHKETPCPYTATRRAIVRAAAEIGRSM